MAEIELEIGEEDEGQRLDVVLARRVEGLNRARAKQWVAEGAALVDGRRVKKSHALCRGERVTIERLPAPRDFDARPDPDAPLEVLLETDAWVVIDKPAGVPSHPLAPGERGTAAGGLVARYPEMRGVGYARREPGILHRLDTDTSGVLLAARDAATFEALRVQLRAGDIDKQYLARCVGVVRAPIVIDTPIAGDPRNQRKVCACSDPREAKRLRASPARTEVVQSTRAANGSLVTVRAGHARRHQIRVHMASIGHPLLGDTLYGGPALEGVERHLLHAVAIRFTDPRTKRSIEVRSKTTSI